MVLVNFTTVDEVAEFLNKPRSWMCGDRETEQVPFRRVGRSFFEGTNQAQRVGMFRNLPRDAVCRSPSEGLRRRRGPVGA